MPNEMPANSLITATDRGLYCPAGDFHIDAWRPVDRTIITHAHSDHARRGCARYLAAAEGAAVLRHRLGADIRLDAPTYGESIEINGVKVSLHPAGHVLGSSQVRIEYRGEVWVISGDYKRDPDPTCRGFELVPCHTFITECTFGLPIFRWAQPRIITTQINDWWRSNRDAGRTSMVLAYSLGKAQRVLASLDASIGPILLHGAVTGMVQVYRDLGIALPPAEYASAEAAKRTKGKGALVIAPPAALGSPWVRKFDPLSAGVASGWMQVRGMRRRQSIDRGFVLSDHVDWPGLLGTIEETGAQRVVATHGYQSVLVRFLRERGIEAYEISTRFKGEAAEVEPEDPAAEPAAEPA